MKRPGVMSAVDFVDKLINAVAGIGDSAEIIRKLDDRYHAGEFSKEEYKPFHDRMMEHAAPLVMFFSDEVHVRTLRALRNV
eukprot:1552251-Prymnesium_polylepis.1